MHGTIDGTRRRALGALGAVALAPMVPVFAPAARAQPLPDRYTLRAAPARLSMLGSEHPQTDLWVYNGRVPGPVLRVRQGERLRVDVVNDLPEATTVHWHGLRLPNAMDGVPDLTQPPIAAAGGRFTYEFVCPDAGTYWYHPHLRGNVQVEMGLAGAVIVEEPERLAVDRDVLWVLDDWRMLRDGQVAPDFASMRDASARRAHRQHGHDQRHAPRRVRGRGRRADSTPPYVLTAHLGDVPGGTPEKTGALFRFVYPFTPPIWQHAAQVVAVSEYTRQLALGHYPVNIQVIPNGVDIHRLNPGQISANACPQIVFAGRFVEHKNPLQIVHSLAELTDLPWQCALLGDGALRTEVIDRIHELGLEERVTLPGWLTPDEVIQQFARSDIYFSPSRSEGLPVVGVQALALGLAIVASHTGGWSDLVDADQHSYLVDANHPEGDSLALRSLLSDPCSISSISS